MLQRAAPENQARLAGRTIFNYRIHRRTLPQILARAVIDKLSGSIEFSDATENQVERERRENANEPKTWKWVSMRPPVTWINRADINIWPTPMTWRVRTLPG
jgi:hypothetical protein